MSGAVRGQAVSDGAADDIDGVFVAPAAAVSCKHSLPGAAQAVLQHAASDPEAHTPQLESSAQEAPEEGSGHLWAGLQGS